MSSSPDGRSPAARAAQWSTRIMTISLEMVVPGLVGYWFDKKLGTKFAFMLVGFVFGFVVSIKHLLYLTRKAKQKSTLNTPTETKVKKEQD
jgi:F0F1-type ATP synthase assembly protein I